MQAYLSRSWNNGIAFGEFTSSLLMVFFLFSFEYFININIKTSSNISKNLFIKPFAFMLSGIISIVFGWIIGSMISGDGYGLSLITPLLATLQAFQWWKFNALWFIICFQLAGTFVGLGMFWLYVRIFSSQSSLTAFRKINVNTFLANPSKSFYKGLLFQPLFILGIWLIPQLDQTEYDTGKVLNTLLLMLVLFGLIFLTQKNNYFVFSPFISIAQILFFCFDNKKALKKGFLSFGYEFGVQVGLSILIFALAMHFNVLTNSFNVD